MVECANLNKWGWEGMNGNNNFWFHPHPFIPECSKWRILNNFRSVFNLHSILNRKPRSVWGSFFIPLTDQRNTIFVKYKGILPIPSLYFSSSPVLFNPVPWEDRKHLLPHGSGSRYRPSEPVDAVPFSSLFFYCYFPANRCGIRVYRCFAGWSEEGHGNTTDRFFGELRSVNGVIIAPISLPVWSHIFQYPSAVLFDFSSLFPWLFRVCSFRFYSTVWSIFSRWVKREKTVKNSHFLLDDTGGKWKIVENGRIREIE